MSWLFTPPPIISLPIKDKEQRFPVRRVFCVGRNYADHVREMGHEPDVQPPIFFTKPIDAVVSVADGTAVIPFARATENLHYEVELVICLNAGGDDLTADQAVAAIYGYAVGLDLTRRDLQYQAQQKAQPWDMAKAFDQSAPIGSITPMPAKVLAQGAISLIQNNIIRQNGRLEDMIWSVVPIIQTLSRFVTLTAGDVIFTGTPNGVGAIAPGDHLVAAIDGLESVSLTIQ
jgi:fumarylpyruvate hydrolase